MIRAANRVTAVPGRPRGRWRAAATLAVVVAAMTSCGSALAATGPRAPAPGHLFSIPTASGSLTGADDQHLTLRLNSPRNYLTRFTAGPPLQALVVADAEFARRFPRTFADSRPDAVLTYTRPRGRVPVSIGLAVGRPRWDGRRRAWTFPAARVSEHPTDMDAGRIPIDPVRVATPRRFTRATLLIESAERCRREAVRPFDDCEGADLAFDNLTDADLTGVDFSGANLTGANLSGADLTGANLSGADLTDASLTKSDLAASDLSGDDLSGESFIAADLTHANLSGADLTGADFPSADLTGAWLTGANLTDTDFAGANLIDTDLSGAKADGAVLSGARVCDAILPGGGIGGGC